MKLNREAPLEDIIGAEPDIEFILDSLRPNQLPAVAAKTLGAVVWGVLPTADWLCRHGWRNPGVCPRCDEADDAAHVMFGCVAQAPDAHRIARSEWKEALAVGVHPEPQVELDLTRYVVTEYIDGCLVAPGTVRFRAGLRTYTDGSADNAGTRFATAAAAVVQLGEDGRSFQAV